MHTEAFQKNTGTLWQQCTFAGEWYLAGGTALALQIGHRVSIDLDFFTPKKLTKDLLSILEKHFEGGDIQVLVNTSTELTALIQGVKVTFLEYSFLNKYPLVPTDIQPLANILDIASMKAYAIGRRQSAKDYVDMYYLLLEKHVTLEQILADATEKFGDAFNSRLFCEQLLFIEDLEPEPIIFLKPEVSLEAMRTFFEGEVRQMAQSF